MQNVIQLRMNWTVLNTFLGTIEVIVAPCSFFFFYPHPYCCAHKVFNSQDGETSMEKLESSPEDPQADRFLCTADGQWDSNFCKLPVLSPYDQFLATSGR
jgi:hypothetical protein